MTNGELNDVAEQYKAKYVSGGRLASLWDMELMCPLGEKKQLAESL